MKYRLKGGILVSGGELLQKDLLTCDGRIEAVIPRETGTGEDYKIIDCSGSYVSPGFVDIHQHGGGGSDYMDGEEDTYLRATEAHLAHGATSVMPTLLSSGGEELLSAVKRYKAAERDGRIKANLIGLHIEGPYISPNQAGAQKREHIRDFDEAEYRAVAAVADGSLKRWSAAPEVTGAERFADFARSEGITLSIAHSDADLDTVRRAYEWGFRHVTHLYSCVSTITRRGGFRVAGVLEAAYLIDGMNVEIIADGCHLPLPLLKHVMKFKAPERIALVTDSMRAAGAQSGESFLGSALDPTPVIIEDGVAKLADRSAFGGSIATCDRLIRTVMKAGAPLEKAVEMVTANPLSMMGLKLKKGKLAEGYDADVCVFDSDINIKNVMVGGILV